MTLSPWLAPADLPPNAPTLPGDEQQQADGWARIIAAASAALWALSGRRWSGERVSTVEVWAPPGHRCADPCRHPLALRLPHRDARDLTAVAHAGAPLDPDAYLIEPGGYLAPRPGRSARMPVGTLPLVLTYRHGANPPPEAVAQVAALALELGREVVEPGSSALPSNVTSIARQGVTYTMQAAQAITSAGSTGLYGVDLWLAAVNPGRTQRPARSWSPDTEARYRILDTTGAPTP